MKRITTATIMALVAAAITAQAGDIEIKPYGFIKLDASLDSTRVSSGNFARWVTGDGNDQQFNMTARQSRFGINFTGPVLDDIETSAKLETDLYNAGGGENRNTFMMRHAYVKMTCPKSDITVLAGQTWDVISPLVPGTINYSVQWWAGDIGYRRPQLRLSRPFALGDGVKLDVAVAATRTIGTEAGAGEDSGVPTAQGRIALTIGDTTLGISGHVGTEEYDEIDDETDTSSICVDLTLPLCAHAKLKAEYFAGQDLDAYLGGIGQGLTMTTDPATEMVTDIEEINSSGGWVALDMGPFNATSFSIGASVDDPDEDDLAPGARSKNTTYWANVKQKLPNNVTLGLEISHWETEYNEGEDLDAMRYQGCVIYNF